MQTLFCLQYRVATELPYRLNKVYCAEEKGNSFVISPSLRLSTPDFFCFARVFYIAELPATPIFGGATTKNSIPGIHSIPNIHSQQRRPRPTKPISPAIKRRMR